MTLTLRPYQLRDKAALYAALKAHRRVILAQATGAGKTRLIESVIRDCLPRRRCAFLVDRIDLIHQTSSYLMDLSPGLMGDGLTPDPSARLQVGTWQTAFLLPWWSEWLSARDDEPTPLIILDEAHSLSWAAPVRELLEAGLHMCIGPTATPERSKRGEGMSMLWDAIVSGASPAELIGEGWLSPEIAYQIDAPAGGRISAPAAIAAGYAGWLRYAEGLPTLAFCETKNHARSVAKHWADAGWRTAVVLGETRRRGDVWDRFTAGGLDLIAGVDVFTKGSDLPVVRCIYDAQRTRSRSRHVQKLGRGARLNRPCEACGVHVRCGRTLCDCGHENRGTEWKAHFIYLDHGGNTVAAGDWGMLEWITSYVMDEPEAPGDGSLVARICPECGALVHPSALVCTECGAQMPRAAKAASVGEFIPLTEADAAAAHWVGIAAARGLDPLWAVYQILGGKPAASGSYGQIKPASQKMAEVAVIAAARRLGRPALLEWRGRLERRGRERVGLAGRIGF